MPKKTKNSNFSLFGCINAPVEQKAMMISKPFELKLSDEVQQGTKKQEIQVKQTPTTSGVEVTDELAKKVAKRRELLDKQDTINTEHTQKNKKKSEEQNTELTEKSEEGKFSNSKAVEVQMQKNVASDQMQNSKRLSLKNIKNDELLKILIKRKEISERISENNEKSEGKFSNPTTVEVQLEQKNMDNISASEQIQNSQDNSSLLQQLQSGKLKLKNRPATEQTNNLPTWVKFEYLNDLNQKKLLQEATQLLESLRPYLEQNDFENYEFNLNEKYFTSQLDEQTLQELKILARSLKGLSKISEQNEDIDENKVAPATLDELQQSIQQEIALLDKLTRASVDEPKIVEMTLKSRR